MLRKKIHCSHCGGTLTKEMEGDILRDFCPACELFFYENPLPVASNIVVKDREILLVKRKNDPFKGLWCLPMGFAESGESIESAALRELEEEAGIKGRITGFVAVESGVSDTYGDLLFLTFETEWLSGEMFPGDDASDAAFYPFDQLPEMAFQSNINAIKIYVLSKNEYWAIVDSFTQSLDAKAREKKTHDFLSDKLIRFIESNAEVISNRWLKDVRNNRSTPTYAKFDPDTSFSRNKLVIRQFGKWLGSEYSNKDIKKFYRQLGADRKNEGFDLSEVLSALSLARKHIWEFALSHGIWDRAIDIYMALELERRMMIFFDKAAFHLAKGFEKTD